MILKKSLIFITIVCLVNSNLIAQSTDKTNGVLNTKPKLINKNHNTVIPIEIWNNKIFLTAKVNDNAYRFILDTGSPTILTTKVANELKLEIKGENTGQDANGNLVKMDLSILEKLQLGDVTIKNIPVFIFDPSKLEIAGELFDGGIIGSEIMPLTNWQINFKDKHIILTDDTSQLDYIKKAQKAELKIYNYPFMPIMEYTINKKFKDNALFDTGSTELLHLFDKAYQELIKQKLVNSQAQIAHGTFGESGGGRGKDNTFHFTSIKKLNIGELDFKDSQVWTRPHAPSLIGSKIFESQIVTLDYTNKAAYFHQYKKPLPQEKSFGFRPYFKDQKVFVGFLKELSPAARSGLQLHNQILKINDTDLTQLNKSELLDTLTLISNSLKEESIEIIFVSNGIEKKVTLKK